MSLFLPRPNINDYAPAFADANALVLDVRERDEYADAHIEGAINAPLSELQLMSTRGDKIELPAYQQLYVHCLSGARSERAKGVLAQLGHPGAVNIGGINDWTGPVTRG